MKKIFFFLISICSLCMVGCDKADEEPVIIPFNDSIPNLANTNSYFLQIADGPAMRFSKFDALRYPAGYKRPFNQMVFKIEASNNDEQIFLSFVFSLDKYCILQSVGDLLYEQRLYIHHKHSFGDLLLSVRYSDGRDKNYFFKEDDDNKFNIVTDGYYFICTLDATIWERVDGVLINPKPMKCKFILSERYIKNIY